MIAPIIVPAPYEDERLTRGGYNEHHDRRICELCGYPPEPVQNVKFDHNPKWREDSGVFSIQAAHNGCHPVWQVIEVLWVIGQISGPVMGWYWLHR